ncbi:MAG: transglycosylase SLT domain-containing protein [Legionellaceae bacterium]|nr:transglycosylase SLT domain-containing protein [Legionellaceae bacterium]
MKIARVLVWAMSVVLSGCATTPPRHVNNICSVFKQHPEWYADTKAAEKRWHVPQTTQMAIIHQESKFNARAKPERTKLLWVIPWTRPSSAYGYAQVLDTTWSGYKRSTGRMFASRSNFADAADFIGWYANQARARAGISPHNTKALYLAYHEGIGGYQRGTYWRKRWLVQVARKVETRAKIYEAQLSRCEATVKRKAWLNWF